MRFIDKRKRFYTVGLDIFRYYLEECKRHGTHDDYVLCDVRKLPVKERSFDAILCMEVLEHLEREQAEELIESLENTGRKQVIITIPVGAYTQLAYDENLYQEHKSTWSPVEFERRGYKVRGVGIRNVGGQEGFACSIPKSLKPFSNIVWILAGLFTYLHPASAGDIVCVKSLSQLERRTEYVSNGHERTEGRYRRT